MNLIYMGSKDFVTKFAIKHDPRKYQYILISRDLESDGSLDNAIVFTELIPPAERVLSHFVKKGMGKSYKKAYDKYLQEPECLAAIQTIMEAVIRYKHDVILLCSEKEMEYQYLKLLTKRIEKDFGIKTVTCEKYMRNPEKDRITKKVRKEAIIEMDKRARDLRGKRASSRRASLFEVKDNLEKAPRKELVNLAIDMGFKESKRELKEMEKKDLIKAILKKTHAKRRKKK